MKKHLALLLVLTLILCGTGCAAQPEQTPEQSGTPSIAVLPGTDTDLGITLTLKDITRSGATVVCTQSGGESIGELTTGSYFVVERLNKDNNWTEVEQLKLDGELSWTAIAYLVNKNGTTEWEVNWGWLYGELPDGHYRIGKQFIHSPEPGILDTHILYTEFSFGEMLIPA